MQVWRNAPVVELPTQPTDTQSVQETSSHCVLFELPFQSKKKRESSAASIWLKRICWVTLFGMRLQKTVNSPTQLRLIQRKQGRDGVNNKAWSRIRCASNHSSSLSSPQNLPLFSLFLVSSPPLFSFPHTSTPPTLTPSSPPIYSCCLGNNTKRFFSAAPSPWQHLAFLQAVVSECAAPPIPLFACADRCSKLECQSVNLPGVLTQISGWTGPSVASFSALAAETLVHSYQTV